MSYWNGVYDLVKNAFNNRYDYNLPEEFKS